MGKRTVSIVLEDERVWEGFCRLVEAKYGRKWKFLGRGALVAWDLNPTVLAFA